MALLIVILNQNSFQYDGKYFEAIKGIAMASPISGFIAELYLQYFEELSIRHWLESREILYYRRYADDILIIFDQTKPMNGQFLCIQTSYTNTWNSK